MAVAPDRQTESDTTFRRAARTMGGPRFSAAIVLFVVLGIFGGAIYLGYRSLKSAVHEQMVDHDGEVLFQIVNKILEGKAASQKTNLSAELDRPGELLLLAFHLSELEEGCLGVRMFDAGGNPIPPAVPETLRESALDAVALRALQSGRQISRFEPSVALSDIEYLAPSNKNVPLLEVSIPIKDPKSPQLLASVQLLLDGENLQNKFAALDANFRMRAWLLFIAGAVFLVCALTWGYWRLEKANRMVAERGARLLRANRELALAAKTTAVGAVTAHLIHGLSNPLANLHELASAHAGDAASEWQEAIAATQRMQQLVREVVRVLSESRDAEYYEINLQELTNLLRKNLQSFVEKSGVDVKFEVRAEGRLASHHANIILLILENLLHNAIQATPRGKAVIFSILQSGRSAVCQITDQGPGIPEAVRKRLFIPCRSTRGGSGLGLAISQQLAQHLGSALELKECGPSGCTFVMVVPESLWLENPRTSARAR
jgi:signal transduction histidine kinase